MGLQSMFSTRGLAYVIYSYSAKKYYWSECDYTTEKVSRTKFFENETYAQKLCDNINEQNIMYNKKWSYQDSHQNRPTDFIVQPVEVRHI